MAAAQAHQYFSFLAGGVDPASARIVSGYGGGRALGVMSSDGPVYLSFPDGAAGPVCTIPQFNAEFDAKAPVIVTGVITRVERISPHGLIHMRGSEPGKPDQTWEIQTVSANTMLRAGLDEDRLKEGATITVEGYLRKDRSCPISAIDGGPSCRVAGQAASFSDGAKIFLGGVPGGPYQAVADRPAGAEWWAACPGWKGAPLAPGAGPAA